MTDHLLNILITFGFGMLPILEVRGAIPFAMGVLHLTWAEAFIWSVLGNITAVAIVLTFLDPLTKCLMKHSPWFNRILTNLFHKTRHKHSAKFNEAGALFLITFVAVPLPITGAWTGALIAYLFGIKFTHALPLLSIGIVIAAILITLGFGSLTAIVRTL